MNIVQLGEKIAKHQLEDISKKTRDTMERLAPHPTGAQRGKGSESTGKTKRSIKISRMSSSEYFIHPTTEYAYFAEHGRGAIDLRGTGRLMSWRDKNGRRHVTPYVSEMEGWHFVEKTAEIIRARYGGK